MYARDAVEKIETLCEIDFKKYRFFDDLSKALQLRVIN